jgi:hypothetical protein
MVLDLHFKQGLIRLIVMVMVIIDKIVVLDRLSGSKRD